jgi:xylulokinase
MEALLGVDLGTTGCKAAAYTRDGSLLGESYLECPLIVLSPTVIEQDPMQWWALTKQAIRLALADAGISGGSVRGLSISSQGLSFVPLGRDGEPLCNAINWLDTRAQEQSAQILRQYSAEELFGITGKRAAPFYMLPKLLWLRQYQPAIFEETHVFLMGHDYLLYKLCGQCVTDHSMAGGTLLYDLLEANWSAELLKAFDIHRDKLPRVEWAGTPVGSILPGAAQELGLSEEVTVTVGGQDQKCAALGAGIGDDIATVSLGTATAITRLTRAPVIDPAMRIPAFAFVMPDRWVLEGVLGTGGGSLRWYRDTVCDSQSYAALDEEAAQVPPGSDGVFFYPHLGGATSPHWQAEARGTFRGLSLSTGRPEMTRAVLEGVAFQIRENLEVLTEITGAMDAIILFGGGAKSPLWRDIISDLTGMPVAIAGSVETATLGACILAGVGSGVFPDIQTGQRRLSIPMDRRLPDPVVTQQYQEIYRKYRELEAKLLS